MEIKVVKKVKFKHGDKQQVHGATQSVLLCSGRSESKSILRVELS